MKTGVYINNPPAGGLDPRLRGDDENNMSRKTSITICLIFLLLTSVFHPRPVQAQNIFQFLAGFFGAYTPPPAPDKPALQIADAIRCFDPNPKPGDNFRPPGCIIDERDHSVGRVHYSATLSTNITVPESAIGTLVSCNDTFGEFDNHCPDWQALFKGWFPNHFSSTYSYNTYGDRELLDRNDETAYLNALDLHPKTHELLMQNPGMGLTPGINSPLTKLQPYHGCMNGPGDFKNCSDIDRIQRLEKVVRGYACAMIVKDSFGNPSPQLSYLRQVHPEYEAAFKEQCDANQRALDTYAGYIYARDYPGVACDQLPRDVNFDSEVVAVPFKDNTCSRPLKEIELVCVNGDFVTPNFDREKINVICNYLGGPQMKEGIISNGFAGTTLLGATMTVNFRDPKFRIKSCTAATCFNTAMQYIPRFSADEALIKVNLEVKGHPEDNPDLSLEEKIAKQFKKTQIGLPGVIEQAESAKQYATWLNSYTTQKQTENKDPEIVTELGNIGEILVKTDKQDPILDAVSTGQIEDNYIMRDTLDIAKNNCSKTEEEIRDPETKKVTGKRILYHCTMSRPIDVWQDVHEAQRDLYKYASWSKAGYGILFLPFDKAAVMRTPTTNGIAPEQFPTGVQFENIVYQGGASGDKQMNFAVNGGQPLAWDKKCGITTTLLTRIYSPTNNPCPNKSADAGVLLKSLADQRELNKPWEGLASLKEKTTQDLSKK